MQEACLRHLAASVRAAHKIHGFAGGFDAELSALFDKVRPLPQLLLSVSCEIKRHCRGTLQGRLACATFSCVMGLPDWTELSTAHGNCMRLHHHGHQPHRRMQGELLFARAVDAHVQGGDHVRR